MEDDPCERWGSSFTDIVDQVNREVDLESRCGSSSQAGIIMCKAPLICSGLACIALLFSACGVTEPPDILGDFGWVELEGAQVVESSAITVVGENVMFVGEFNTSTACYSLVPQVSTEGSKLVLIVEARATKSTTCAERPGAYRYQGQLRPPAGAGELRVLHRGSASEASEFSHQLR